MQQIDLITFTIIILKRKKELLYLTKHSTHFSYGYMMKELTTKKKRIFFTHHSADRITRTAFLTPVTENWLEREILHPFLLLIFFKEQS